MAAVGVPFLVDKSAFARWTIPAVRERLDALILHGRLATCAIVDLEVLFSARNFAEYERTMIELRGLREAPITPAVMDHAIELQHALARRGQHRLPIQNLIISAAAAAANFTVLHYDADYELIAKVGGAPQEWVVRKGSLR